MPRTRRPYSAEFRRRLVELVRGGQTPEDTARKFEPSANAMRNWVVQAARDEGRRPDGLTTDEKAEVRRLRREVLACPRCGGRLWVIDAVQDPAAVQALLTHRARSGAPAPTGPAPPAPAVLP